MASTAAISHLVVPGQIIATSTGEGDGGFLRGHGTYIETISTPTTSSSKNATPGVMENESASRSDANDGDEEMASESPSGAQRLVASVVGTVERVNKLISVIPASPTVYSGQVGDLIVGRITSVGANRWRVALSPTNASREGQLPLSGVNLPGGVQRIRTAEDALGMRALYGEGDLVSAEVQSVQNDGTLLLHTRSLRYGKLENGVFVFVPPGLIQRMKVHFVTLDEPGVDLLIGTNGGIWIQRAVPKEWSRALSASGVADEEGAAAAPLAETLQKIKQKHKSTPVLIDEREAIARVRNSVECLRMVYAYVTPQNILGVYKAGLNFKISDMLRPEVVVEITSCTRP